MKIKALITTLLLSFSIEALASFTKANPATIYMTVWRGCEEACQGFKQYLEEQELPVNIILRDAGRDKSKIPQFLAEAKRIKPDLVVTWGTSVSKGIIGPIKEGSNETNLGDIPALFMVVADPIGAGIVESYERSGRPTITGTRNRVPEEVQMRTIKDYLDPKRIGVIYSTSELNSVLNTEKLEQLANEMDFQLIKRSYTLNDKGKPAEDQIPQLMQQMADENVDIVYVGSSSYNRQKRDEFTAAALAVNIPVASAYEVMVTKSDGLLAVANRYYNVGRLAGSQAKKVLFDGEEPGTLPIPSLSRYSIFINIEVAKKLNLFPPIQLLRFAELVNVEK